MDGSYLCPTASPPPTHPHPHRLTSVSLLNCLNMRPTSWANSWGELEAGSDKGQVQGATRLILQAGATG